MNVCICKVWWLDGCSFLNCTVCIQNRSTWQMTTRKTSQLLGKQCPCWKLTCPDHFWSLCRQENVISFGSVAIYPLCQDCLLDTRVFIPTFLPCIHPTFFRIALHCALHRPKQRFWLICMPSITYTILLKIFSLTWAQKYWMVAVDQLVTIFGPQIILVRLLKFQAWELIQLLTGYLNNLEKSPRICILFSSDQFIFADALKKI